LVFTSARLPRIESFRYVVARARPPGDAGLLQVRYLVHARFGRLGLALAVPAQSLKRLARLRA